MRQRDVVAAVVPHRLGQSRGPFRRRRTRRLGGGRAGAGRRQRRSILPGRLLGDQPKPADRRRHRTADRGRAHGGQCLPPRRRAGGGRDDQSPSPSRAESSAPARGWRAGGAPWTNWRCRPLNWSRRRRRGWAKSCRRAISMRSRVSSRPGLKLAAGDRRRRLKFFTLQDELARRLIERASAGIGFAETERQTKAFVTSLWGRPPLLRSFSGDTGQTRATPCRDRGAADPSAGYLSRRAGRGRLRALQGRGGACPGASRVRRARDSRSAP